MNSSFRAGLALLLVAIGAQAQTTVFTYQGRLQSNSVPLTGTFDLRFTLHDLIAGGSQFGPALTNAPLSVENGLFTTVLNFGAVFDGSPRWLQIGVRTNGDTNQYTFLTPRQQITSTPYAIKSLTSASATALTGPLFVTNITGTIATSNLPPNIAYLNSNANFSTPVSAPVFLGPLPATNLTGTVPDSRLSSNVAFLNKDAIFTGVVRGSNFFGNGVGLTNVPGFKYPVIPTAVNVQGFRNFGYLATNDNAAVVVTLPDSPNLDVGDTIRVAASGAGGWIIAQNAGQTILVGNMRATVGQSWIATGAMLSWKGLASASDGKKLVATANPGGIYTSTNYGATWQARAGSPAAACVASSGNGTKLVAAVNGGGIYTSTDSGGGWTPHLPNLSWTAVASSLDGTRLLASATGVGGGLYVSPDSGGSWPSVFSGSFTAVASSADGTKLVAGAQGGFIYTSTNSGTSWGPHGPSGTWAGLASSADGSRLVAVMNGGFIYVSADYGTNWMQAGTSQNWMGTASSADGSELIAVNSAGGVQISTDSGLTWLARTLPVSPAWTAATMSSDASTLAVAGTSSLIYGSSQAATTTGTAGALIGNRLAAVELEYVGGGVFIPVSFVGGITTK